MKYFGLQALFVFVVLSASAGSVTFHQAKNIATQVLGNSSSRTISIELSASDGYFIAQDTAEGGWVLISCTTDVDPILAYSKTGVFFRNEHHFSGASFLSGRIAHASKQTDLLWKMADSGGLGQSFTRSAVEPLVSTQWGQDTPYNDSCPLIDGERALTGCGATTVSQLLNYYKFPEVGTGSMSYIDSDAGAVSVDFSQARYNWVDMTDADIAKLLYHCGVASRMDYGLDGSSSASLDIITGMTNAFGYSPTVRNYFRYNFTSDQWEAMIKNELDNGRPVVYAANSEQYEGHIWICDGYDQYGNFHMNWGWNGRSDGYYNLKSLIPSGEKLNFALNDEIIIGIEPDRDARQLCDLGFFGHGMLPVSVMDYKGDLNVANVVEEGRETVLSFMLQNLGRVDFLGNLSLYVSVDGEVYVNGLMEDVEIGVRSNVMQRIFMESLPAGMHSVFVSVDYFNDIKELNETNNSYEFEFEVKKASSLPNLAFFKNDIIDSDFRVYEYGNYDFSSSVFSPEKELALTYCIANDAGVDITKPFDVAFFLNDNEIFTVTSDNLAAMSYARDIDVELGRLEPGEYELTCAIDLGKDVKELTEEDNAKTIFLQFLLIRKQIWSHTPIAMAGTARL